MKLSAVLLFLGLGLAASLPARAADVVGKASIGFSAGPMMFLTGDKYKETSPRLIGQAVFKYGFSPSWSGVLETGWGWSDFPDGMEVVGADTLVTVIPTTIGMEYRRASGQGGLWPHVAAGGGIYALGVKDTFRSWAKAGDKVETLTWVSPGFYGKVGTEYFFNNSVAMNFDLLFHYIISKDEGKFGFVYRPGDENDPQRTNLSNTWGVVNTSFTEFRIGVNYYFSSKRTESEKPGTP